jgi:hypothetical protein
MVWVCAGAELVELGRVDVLDDGLGVFAFAVMASTASDAVSCAMQIVGSCMSKVEVSRATRSHDDDLEVNKTIMKKNKLFFLCSGRKDMSSTR